MMKKTVSHLPLVVCNHADNFGFICPGFHISVSDISGEWNFISGVHSKKLHFKDFNSNIFFSRNTVHITLDNLFSWEKINLKLSAWLDTTKAVVPNPWSATPQVVIIKKNKKNEETKFCHTKWCSEILCGFTPSCQLIQINHFKNGKTLFDWTVHISDMHTVVKGCKYCS